MTNAIQWHQITGIIFKMIFYLTLKWQSALGQAQRWSHTSISRRLIILIFLTTIWTVMFVIYVLIIVAFFKTLLSTQLILTLQTNVLLLVPLLFIPLPLFNALTMLHWTRCTIRKKSSEQETANAFDTCRNVFIYGKDEEL